MRLLREGLGLFLIVLWSTLGFWLPSPNEGTHCDPEQATYAHFSRVWPARESYVLRPLLYPLSILATPRDFELVAGECLYIPTGWWHWVRSGHATIGVNFWHAENTLPAEEQSSFLESYHRVLSRCS